MYSKCEHCGEFAVDDSENIVVCKSCGIVVEDSTLFGAEYISVTKRTFTPFSKSAARLHNQKKKTLALQHGQSVLDNLYYINNIPCISKAEITDLFKLVESVRHFSNREDAGITAACCLYLVQRKNKHTISIKSLCKQVPCTRGKFSHFLKYLKSCLSSNDEFKQYSSLLDNGSCDSQEKEAEDVSDVVPSLIREVCEKAEKEEKSELMKKTASLVKLADSCWLFTGRSPRSIVVASAFLCWKSMHPSRKKASYAKFCSKFEICESTARLRIPELRELLLKLGEKIPSRTKNYVNEDNLLFHLNTILEHSETLRNDLFPDACTGDEVDALEFTNFRYPPVNSVPRKEPTNGVQYDSDMNASDVEISDSEIDSYLISNKKRIIELCSQNNSKASS